MSSPRVQLSLHYLFGFGALGALAPLLPVLWARRGFTAADISWALMLAPAANLLSPPLWGLAADRWRVRGRSLFIVCCGCALAVLALGQTQAFGLTLALFGCYCFFRAPMVALADAATHAHLGPARERFATIRIWGSVGFAAGAAALGLAEGASRPFLLFTTSSAAYVAAALAVARLAAEAPPAPRYWAALAASLEQPQMLLFLLSTATYYGGHIVFDGFYGVHLQRIGFGQPFIGLAWSTGVVAEIGVMIAAPALLRRVRPPPLLAGCALVAAARWTAIARLRSGPGLLAAQTLHGVTFGLWYLNVARLVQERSPEHLRAGLQGIALAAIGLGQLVGLALAGRTMALGGTTAYGAAALFAGAAAVGYGALVGLSRPADRPQG